MQLNNYPLWTALITPFKPGLSVDFDSLKNIIKEQDDAGNGHLVLGSTGEALNIDLETRKSIVEFVIGLSPKSPIMVGVGGHQLSDQVEWIKWLETKKIDAYLMVTPIYSKPGDEGQYLWFKTLMDKVSRPVMLYNVPSRAGKELSFSAVKKLASHKNYWGIKEASGSAKIMKKYLDASGGKPVYCGDDGLLFDFVQNGSCGLISVASNTWPSETHLYVKQCLNKTFDAKEMWAKAANSLFIASNPIPAKALLCHEKRIAHDTMMPPLYRGDLTNMNLLVQSTANIRSWYKDQKNKD